MSHERSKSKWRAIRRGLLGALLLIVVIAVAAALWLILPGTPSEAQTLDFNGYIKLPSHTSLSVLDYLTLNGNQLYVTGESGGDVYRITLPPDREPAGATVASMPGPPAAHGVALLPSDTTAFVSRSESNSVDVFDAQALRVLDQIPVEDDADAILYDPDTGLIYVASGDAHMATLIDPKARKVVATIQLGAKPEFQALDQKAHLLYQNLQDINSVAAIDLSKRQITEKWPLEGCDGPTGMALDSAGQHLFIGCNHNDKLVVFDLAAHRVIATVPIGGGPDSVAFDGGLHRIYATGKSGVMTVIDQKGNDTYQVIDTVRLHYGAHTLAVDPATHKLFVAYAGLLAAPRVAVFTPRAHPAS
jgi:YVTN family beta-propeller protein